jgi:DNA-binding CsgD family transcriptional regulator
VGVQVASPFVEDGRTGYSVIPRSTVYIRPMSTRGRPRHPDILTPREWEVHGLIRQGASNEDIARLLNITERTAKYHVSEILSKLGVSSREEAVTAIAERSARPTGLAGLFGHWPLFAKVAASSASAAALGGVAVLAWGVLNGGYDSNAADTSFANVYSSIVRGAAQEGKILHTTSSVDYPAAPGGGSTHYSTEYWIDAGADVVRQKLHTPEEALGQQMGNTEHIYSGPYTYFAEDTGGVRLDSEILCPESQAAVIGILLGCKSGPRTEQDVPTVSSNATWEGGSALAIEWTVRLL